MTVKKLYDPHIKRVEAVLEDMLRRTRAGRLPSLLFIVEEIGKAQPHYGIVGRFRADPARALGHLGVMKEKVREYAVGLAPDLDPE